MLHAAMLLSNLYKSSASFDSAFQYQELSMNIKDCLFNIEKIKQVQNLSYNEQLRQQEIIEQKIQEQRDRRNSLQLIAIAVFIATFLLIVLLLGQKSRPRVSEFLAVLALLLLFEFFNFLIHPYIGKLTRYTPVFYLLASVLLASILAPIHHHATLLIKRKLLKQSPMPLLRAT